MHLQKIFWQMSKVGQSIDQSINQYMSSVYLSECTLVTYLIHSVFTLHLHLIHSGFIPDKSATFRRLYLSSRCSLSLENSPRVNARMSDLRVTQESFTSMAYVNHKQFTCDAHLENVEQAKHF